MDRDRDRELILGVRKIVQRQQSWGHHSHENVQRGYARVYQKAYFPYLDSAEDEKEEERKYEGGGEREGRETADSIITMRKKEAE